MFDSETASASRSVPGVTKSVPLAFSGTYSGDKMDRTHSISDPDVITQALHVEPGFTAPTAASILAAMPPRPEVFGQIGNSWLSGNMIKSWITKQVSLTLRALFSYSNVCSILMVKRK